MATNKNAFASLTSLALVCFLGTTVGAAAAAPGNGTSAPAARASIASDVKTKIAATRLQGTQTKANTTKLKTTGRLAPGTTNTLNPQPLPPRRVINTRTNPGTTRGLNPQPLPPKAGGGM